MKKRHFHLTGAVRDLIYWLISSGKHGACQALVYLHRYTESTHAGMQQVLRLGQAIGWNLELGFDDASSPGVRCRIPDAAEEWQAVCH